MSSNPWSVYWESPQLHSCAAGINPKDQQQVEAFWRDFAVHLESGSKIIDMATGNGAVPHALLSGNSDLDITAIDIAEIQPEKLFAQYPTLAKVEFHSNVDITNVDAELISEGTAEYITSQFGVEYAELAGVINSAHRLLISGGKIRWLMHNKRSELLKSSAPIIAELTILLQPSGLIETLIKWSKGEISIEDLEREGRDFLASKFAKSERISGQVFSAIEQLIQAKGSQKIDVEQASKDMSKRMLFELQRLEQLSAAALSETDVFDLEKLLQDRGFGKISINKFMLDPNDYLLGWTVEAEKQ